MPGVGKRNADIFGYTEFLVIGNRPEYFRSLGRFFLGIKGFSFGKPDALIYFIDVTYIFFLDLFGHFSDTDVAEALEELGHCCQFLKILGSYPRSV